MGLQEVIQQQQHPKHEQLSPDQVCICAPGGCHVIPLNILTEPVKALNTQQPSHYVTS